jgi:hypothetical protein
LGNVYWAFGGVDSAAVVLFPFSGLAGVRGVAEFARVVVEAVGDGASAKASDTSAKRICEKKSHLAHTNCSKTSFLVDFT